MHLLNLEIGEKTEFLGMFEITRYIIFEVNYYTLGSNKNARFTISSNQLNRFKSDYSCRGQAQESLLPKNSIAFNFFKKWDEFHLSNLTDSQYVDLIKDLKELSIRYNSKFYRGDRQNIPFYDVVAFSKLPLKV